MKRMLSASMVAIALFGILGGAVACRHKRADMAPDAAPMADEKSAVCLVDGLGLRNAVGKSAKYVASLALGETVKLVGDPEKDESGKDWQKIELSDGKSGYVSAAGLVANAQIGAVKDDATSYKRPDLLTASAQKVPFMTIVAVTQQKDSWLQVVGEGKRSLGWLRKDVVSLDKEDVTAAILATKKLRDKNDGLDPAKKVEAIVAAAPNPNGYFIQKLKERSASAPAVPPQGEMAQGEMAQ
ncbi:MAG TPA: SH3 domain-containing protein [Holophaga sp.]|nr:SH3 domain-containing protein [Holophaga sp.]